MKLKLDVSKSNDELARFEADTFHEVLNRFIADGIAFEVSAEDFQAEAENFFKPAGKAKVLAYSEILNAILDALDEIDFRAAANLDDDEKSFATSNKWAARLRFQIKAFVISCFIFSTTIAENMHLSNSMRFARSLIEFASLPEIVTLVYEY